MSNLPRRTGRAKPTERFWFVLAMIVCGEIIAADTGQGQPLESLAGESAAEDLAKSISTEQYNQMYGPISLRTTAGVSVNYTDNVFYSYHAQDDIMIEPHVSLDSLWPITPLNTLRLTLGLSYEWYMRNPVLNANGPLVNPGSELAFNLFVGDFRIRLHDRFSYQESLFINSPATANEPFYNFNNVGTFKRLDNYAGFDVAWDLNRVVLTAGYDHENFDSYTSGFEYLDRSSEWLTSSAALKLGDHVQTGLEGKMSWNDYDQQTILNDNWRVQVGPFVEATVWGGIKLRAGGGFDQARYDVNAGGNSDYDNFYAYGSIRQQLRFFSHALEAGRETVLGANANNMRTTYAGYTISSPIIAHIDVKAHAFVNAGEEFGGAFDEKFTYYDAGIKLGYQWAKNWRTELGYGFLLKRSDIPLRAFQRDMATIDMIWSF
jgi:hypothetical protein